MLYLKLAEASDLPEFLELTEELFNHSVYSTIHSFDRKYITQKFLSSLEEPKHKVCTVLLLEDGKTIGLITMASSNIFSEGSLIATELALWISKEDKRLKGYKKLLEAYFFWAKEIGCTHALVGKIKGKNTPEMFYTRRLK